MTTWQEAARGIPVWPQALTRRISGLADVLALDNADTQAMYLPRLAIALGCPEDIAEDGVVVYMGRDGWSIGAGAFDVEPSEATNHLRWQLLRWVYGDGQPRPIASGDLSRVEALAIAWPQDKRVPRD